MARKGKAAKNKNKETAPAAAAAAAAAQPSTPSPSSRPTFPPGDARSVLSSIRWGPQQGAGLEVRHILNPSYLPYLPLSRPLQVFLEAGSTTLEHMLWFWGPV